MSGTTPITLERANRNTLRKVLAFLAVLSFAVLWFGNLEYRDLVDPDEGRYAEIPREMAVTGDWVTPRLNDLKYFEKPVLQYWATAALYTAFGVDEWVARLWPALAGLFGIGLTFFAGRRLFGPRVAVLAALILSGTLHYVVFAHILTLDMTVTLFLTLTMLAVAIAQRDAATAPEQRGWMLAAWASMAGALLSKGLIGVVLPMGTLAVYILVQRDWSLLKRLHPLEGIALLLVLAAPWFIVVSLRNPEFARFFFWHEHVERFLLPGHHRPGAWWYFVGVGLAGALPWTGLLLAGLPRWWNADPIARFQPARLLVVWVVVVTAFFSASSSKLPGYILPVFPALAILLALRIDAMRPRTLAAALAVIVPLVLVALALEPKAGQLKSRPDFELYFGAFLPWLQGATVALAVGVAAGAVLAWRQRPIAAVAATAVGSLLAITIAMTADEELSPIFSAQHSAAILAERFPVESRTLPFYSIRAFGQSLPFALGRSVTLVEYGGELDPGIEAEPEKARPTLDAFRVEWLAHEDAFAVMPPDTFRQLQDEGLPMAVVLRDPVRVFVRRGIAGANPD